MAAGGPIGLDEPLLAAAPPAEAAADRRRRCQSIPRHRSAPDLGPITIPAPGKVADVDPAAELARVRADVDFWAARLTARPADIVAAVKLAESDAPRRG